MRLADSTYERSYTKKKTRVLTEHHPLLARAMGTLTFQKMLTDYLHRHPSESFRPSDLSAKLHLFLRQNEQWKMNPYFSELARLELYKIRAHTKSVALATAALKSKDSRPREVWLTPGLELMSTFYHLPHQHNSKKSQSKARYPNYYAICYKGKGVRVAKLSAVEHRILHWLQSGCMLDALIRRAAKFKISEKRFFLLFFKLRKQGLVEHAIVKN